MQTYGKRSHHRQSTSQAEGSQHEQHGSSSQLMGPSQGYPPSHEVAPEPNHHEASPSSGVQPRKQTRGPNKAIPPPLPGQDRIIVPINKVGQPTGNEAGKLSRFIGVLVKDGDILPINYTDWRQVPNSLKQGVMDRVLTVFDLPPREEVREWVDTKTDVLWKSWKDKLFAKWHKPHLSLDEQMTLVDQRAIQSQWRELVAHRRTDEAKAMSRRNKENRSQLRTAHTAGTRSFAQYRAAAQARNPDGQEPDRMQMYHMMHIRRDGTFVDQASADLYTQTDELVSQHPEGTTSSTARNEVFTQVMGPDTHGRVRTYGLGVKPSQLRSADSDQWRRRAEELASQNESLVAKQDEMRAELVAMNSRMKVFEDWMSHMGGASHILSGSTPVPYMDPDATQTPDDTDFL